MEDLVTQPDVQHLLLIGAYRDNEVDATHPLMRKLDAMRQAGGYCRTSCSRHSLVKTSTIDCGLSSLRTGACRSARGIGSREDAGNPFFAIQFFCTV